MNKTVGIISLGCPRNLVDSEMIISEFTKKGYKFKKDAFNSDTAIVNTCVFVEDAKRESVDAILKVIDAKKCGNIKKIIVAGCLPERYRDELAGELKEVDEFRGVLDFNKFLQPKYKSSGQARLPYAMLTPKHYVYIKISEGCANRCTYCIIPYLKGSYKSRPLGSIKKEAALFIRSGAREIILIGQDTSLYGIDLYGKKRLADLLKELAGISKDVWIRLLYLHPANLDKEVIKIIKDNENICKFIDLPLEHINDRILTQMARKMNKKEIISFIDYIRKEMPDVSIRTSFIVGFPGETDKEFKELVSFIKEMEFERLGVFKYSREEGTPAYNYKGQVSEKEKETRFNGIMLAQQSVSRKINEKFKGRVLKVLVEEKNGAHPGLSPEFLGRNTEPAVGFCGGRMYKDYYTARTEYDAPDIDGLVYVKGKNLKIGNFYNVKITDTYEYDLTGEVIFNLRS